MKIEKGRYVIDVFPLVLNVSEWIGDTCKIKIVTDLIDFVQYKEMDENNPRHYPLNNFDNLQIAMNYVEEMNKQDVFKETKQERAKKLCKMMIDQFFIDEYGNDLEETLMQELDKETWNFIHIYMSKCHNTIKEVMNNED